MPNYQVITTPAVIGGHHRRTALVTTSRSREQLTANLNLIVEGPDYPVSLVEGRRAVMYTEISVVSAQKHLLFTIHEIESEEEKQAHNSEVMRAVLGGRDPGHVQQQADAEGWEATDRDIAKRSPTVRVYASDSGHIWVEHTETKESACFSGPRINERVNKYLDSEYPGQISSWNVGPGRTGREVERTIEI